MIFSKNRNKIYLNVVGLLVQPVQPIVKDFHSLFFIEGFPKPSNNYGMKHSFYNLISGCWYVNNVNKSNQ